MKRRPTKFENVPELLTLFGEAADLRPPESFAVTRPDARHHTVVIPASPETLRRCAKNGVVPVRNISELFQQLFT